jgi:TonB family protein
VEAQFKIMHWQAADSEPGFLRAAALLVLVFFAACTTLQCQEVPKDAAPSSQQTPSGAAIPAYPNTAQGLEKLIKEMMKLAKNGDHDELAAYAKSLVLPGAENWFNSVFGSDLGAQLAVVSERGRREFQVGAPDALADLMKEHRTLIEVVRFDDDCNARASSTEYPFLVLRERPEPLYDVRFSDSRTMTIWAYFAYVDGGFRYIGSLKRNNSYSSPRRLTSSAPPPPQPSKPQSDGGSGSDRKPEHVQVGGIVQSARLIHQEAPVYPPGAKMNHVQGTVVLHAIIAKDGSVKNLDVIEGQCDLVKSAADAVQKWRYRPTLFNGEPIEVDTTISVIFTLNR